MSNRKQHWEQVYSDKSPLEVSWYQKEPALSLSFIKNCRIGKDEAIIDVGGGASLLVDYLLQQGYQHLAVLDISANSLAYAKQRLAEQAENVEWFEADITEFKPPHHYSIWHDRAVFHFLTIATDRQKYIEVLKASLKPGGHAIIAAFAVGGSSKCSGLDIVQYDAEKLLKELGSDFELVEEGSESHLTPGEKQQQFSYFRLLRK